MKQVRILGIVETPLKCKYLCEWTGQCNHPKRPSMYFKRGVIKQEMCNWDEFPDFCPLQIAYIEERGLK